MKVVPLAEGKSFTAKQMSGRIGELLPEHRASEEPVLLMQGGYA